jgi:hypothetical protein
MRPKAGDLTRGNQTATARKALQHTAADNNFWKENFDKTTRNSTRMNPKMGLK